MVEISAEDLHRVCQAQALFMPGSGHLCESVVIDSRQVAQGCIFVAFPGERVDGNDFILDAIRAGAGAVVCSRPGSHDELVRAAREAGCALFLDEQPTLFLLKLAAWYRERLGAIVVGVTGSVGKTTTKDMLASVLSKRFRVHATQGNFNNRIGMPLTVLSAPSDTEVLVLEMGMNSKGEIGDLSRFARPNVGVITRVGTSHIGMLGSRAAIAEAKAEIMEGMSTGSVLVLSGEDDFTPYLAARATEDRGLRVLSCGGAADDDVRGTDVSFTEDGRPRFALELPGGEVVGCELPITGAQAVANAVLAAGVAHELGLSGAEITAGLAAVRLTGRRQELRRAGCGARVIDDSYNASPESMAAGLDLLAQLPCAGRRVAVLGEMGELGGDAPLLHGLVGAYAAAKRPDLLVCVGGHDARAMADAARTMGLPASRIRLEPSCDALIAGAAGLLGAQDVVLVKGSRFVGLDRFVEEVARDVQ